MKTKEQRLVEIETAKLAQIEKIADKAIKAQENKLREARRAFQKVCKHEKIKESDAHDYHNNCPWTQKDCLICGAYLGKY
jgi:Spy/CpxP family protein refolding chaperone